MTAQPIEPAYRVFCIACGGTRAPDAPPCRCRLRPLTEEGTYPDLEEVDRYVRTAPDAARVEYLSRLLAAAHRGDVCVMAEHDGYPRQVDSLIRQLLATMTKAQRWRRLATHRHTTRALP